MTLSSYLVCHISKIFVKKYIGLNEYIAKV